MEFRIIAKGAEPRAVDTINEAHREARHLTSILPSGVCAHMQKRDRGASEWETVATVAR